MQQIVFQRRKNRKFLAVCTLGGGEADGGGGGGAGVPLPPTLSESL